MQRRYTPFPHAVYSHATEKEAVGVSLVMWGQVVVVKHTDPEHSRIHTDTQEEDGKEASNLKKQKQTDKRAQIETNGLQYFAKCQTISLYCQLTSVVILKLKYISNGLFNHFRKWN